VPAKTPHILLVNPWIHDFAAYDVWAKPLGLLYLAALLRQRRLRVSLIDCLDRFHPTAPPQSVDARRGRGPYLKTLIAVPAPLSDIPRRYSRYGIDPKWFLADLARLDPPDLVLVTSQMTYWYPGVIETIAYIRSAYPEVPIWLGGIYATLCPEHARAHSGADRIFVGPFDKGFFEALQGQLKLSLKIDSAYLSFQSWPLPALDLLYKIAYLPLLTGTGCPYRCAYCASGRLNPTFTRRTPQAVAAEITNWHGTCGVTDIALYDDAFLVDAQRHAVPLLEQVISMNLPVRFHTPNALHIRDIDAQTVQLLFKAGFVTLRLGLETAADNNRGRMDNKVTMREFKRAATHLQQAGFTREQVGAYLLVGLPYQRLDEVYRAIDIVKNAGITPILAYFSPIPHTAMWPAAVKTSRYDLQSDPIFTNNAIFPCWPQGFAWETISALKEHIRHR
jgi:radical SAM superfamily enzyme YgiQ (UPF0313 family)